MNQQSVTVMRHIIGLDRAIGAGCKVSWNNKEWTLTPLRLADFGELVANNKAKALETYLAGIAGVKVEQHQRTRDIHSILFRAPIPEDFSMANPITMFSRLKLALKPTHPTIDDQTISSMLNDATFMETVAVLMDVQDFGIGDKPAVKGDDGTVNPTTTPSTTSNPASASA